MDWYYVEADQQVGPLTETDFEDLVRSGKITQETLVWREGMTEWQPYGQVPGNGGASGGVATKLRVAPAVASPGGIVCSECGDTFGSDEVIRYGGVWVCATCKPTFVQRLKEGVAQPAVLDYAGFWIRFAAQFVDGLILWLVNMALALLVMLPLSRTARDPDSMGMLLAAQGFLLLIQFAIGITYEVWFLGKFGATPGKMACRLKVVTPEGYPISYGRAFGRYFAKLLSGLILCIGYLLAAFDDEKRALHDRICNTRVIRVR